MEDEPSAIQYPEQARENYDSIEKVFSVSDVLSLNINNLESRLKICDEVYKLATETNSSRSKEYDRNLDHLASVFHSITVELDAIEDEINSIPDTIKSAVKEEMEKQKINQNSDDIYQTRFSELDLKITQLEKVIAVQNDEIKKALKKIQSGIVSSVMETSQKQSPEYDDISSEISELEKTQAQVMDLLGKLQQSPLK